MSTLSSSNSLFELAFGINAIMPIVSQKFYSTKREIALLMIEKIKFHLPEFELSPTEKMIWLDLAQTNRQSLNRTKFLTSLVILSSLVSCGISLILLIGSSIKPEFELSETFIIWFTYVNFVLLPFIYFSHTRLLNKILFTSVIFNINTKPEAEIFAQSIKDIVFSTETRQHRKQERVISNKILNHSLFKMKWGIRKARASALISRIKSDFVKFIKLE